ncbi:phage tail protein [Citrobacter freundii]|uniref:phage tail-collar fiber domain-containing protein n=1 Tax=Citrobacter freundii TaxID=546 RepID=UPI001902650D|nr:phage tail protein [Citrobacter freundii]MBJ9312855.1 phage tail protein [Citrobacter freundii]HEI8942034.1 phage tail protein [Citrobacter freundii]HEJ0169076.1 phage tail protein [Citrobacter freundii]
MSKKFKTIITTAGAEKLAAATVPGGKKVNLTAMAVGDGGGTLPEPDAGQTKLINEVWRHALNKISQDNKNKNYIVAELVIPPDVGGFWMRELGLYDDAGTLIAVANMAESYKPKLAEGSGRAQTCRMVIIVSNVDSVALSIDATTVMATQDYVDDKLAEHEQSRRHPDATLKEKGFVQLSSATDSASESHAATPKAVKTAYDLANGKYTAQDASTAQKGIVQLSSATDSNDEGKAATPKAVKTAYDLANGKYTAQDASTTQKGIVQLSSATDSDDEGKAATSKAVKAANDNAERRLAKEQNGRDIPNKPLFVQNIGLQDTVDKAAGAVQRSEVQTSQDDVTAGKLLVNGSAIAVRSISAINGGQVDDANNLPVNAASFVYGDAKNSPSGNTGTILDVSGLGSGYSIQLFANYSTGEILAFRARNGDNRTWNKWNFVFHTGNKPTSTDVGALPITGGDLKGQLSFSFSQPRNGANHLIYNGDDKGILACGYGYYQDRFDIHFYDENGAWASNPLSIGRNGNTTVSGNLSGHAVYEGNTRVYSPNNPPPAPNLSGYATQQWVLQNFVQNIDLTAPAEVGFWDGRGYMRPTDGAAMYNFNMVGGSSNVGNFIIRYMRKQVNNTWYVIN